MKDNDIISFEMAKKAKSAGLRLSSRHYYDKLGKLNVLGTLSLDFNISEGFYTAITYKKYLNWINTKDNDNSRNWTPTLKGRRSFF